MNDDRFFVPLTYKKSKDQEPGVLLDPDTGMTKSFTKDGAFDACDEMYGAHEQNGVLYAEVFESGNGIAGAVYSRGK